MRLPLPTPRSRPRHPTGRRGNYTILFALTTTTLISFAAFAIDLPYAGLVSDQLQSGVDAAAHAAVMRLDGTEDGMADAEETALAFANHHKAGTSAIDLSRTDVRFGAWVDGAFVKEIGPRHTASPGLPSTTSCSRRRARIPPSGCASRPTATTGTGRRTGA